MDKYVGRNTNLSINGQDLGNVVTSVSYSMPYNGYATASVDMIITDRDKMNIEIGNPLDFAISTNSPSVVKCQYCQQWGARKCACKHCGAPIE